MKQKTKTFSIRIEEATLNQVKDIANKKERSTNAQLIYLIKQGLNKKEK